MRLFVLLRSLLLLLVGWIVMRILLAPLRSLARDARRPGESAPGRPAGPSAAPEAGRVKRLVQDPVCGVRVPQDKALAAGGQYFCSATCRDHFLAAPRPAAS